MTNGYRRALRAFLHYRWVAVVLFLVGLGLTYVILKRVPTGFVPTEDQGYFIVIVQSPAGASLEYTSGISAQVTKIMNDYPEVEGTFALSGFSFSGSASNLGLVFVPLKPYEKRKGDEHSATAIVNKSADGSSGSQGALVLAFEPPAVQGLGQFGGFAYEVQDQGGHSLQELADSYKRHGSRRQYPQRKRSGGLVHQLHRQRSAIRGDD